MPGMLVIQAQENLLRAALRVMEVERADEHVHSADESEYASELLALAARALTVAVNVSDKKPVGW